MSGAATVEFAATLPLVLLSALLIAQVALSMGAEIEVVHAAREGARAAAVWNDDARARDAALAAGNLASDRTEVTVSPSTRAVGDPVTVTVTYRAPVVMPFIGRFFPSEMRMHASVTARTERAPPP